MSARIPIVCGSDWSQRFRLRDSAQQPVTTYTATATLAAAAWTGDDRAPAFAVAAAWSDAPGAFVALGVLGADTASIAPGLYRVLLDVTASGVTTRRLACLLELLAAPGSAAADPTYCSFDDVRKVAPWIADLIADDPSLQSDLAEHRGSARARIDDCIVACWRPDSRLGPGYGASILGVSSLDPNNTAGAPSEWLRGKLDADALMVAGSRGRKVREIAARLTVAYACEPQLGKGPGDTPYQAIARDQLRRGYALLAGLVAELDTDADGVRDLVVNCGVLSAR